MNAPYCRHERYSHDCTSLSNGVAFIEYVKLKRSRRWLRGYSYIRTFNLSRCSRKVREEKERWTFLKRALFPRINMVPLMPLWESGSVRLGGFKLAAVAPAPEETRRSPCVAGHTSDSPSFTSEKRVSFRVLPYRVFLRSTDLVSIKMHLSYRRGDRRGRA